MLKALTFVSLPLLIVLPASTQQSPAPAESVAPGYYAIPLDAAKKENPVKPTPESLARGKRHYGYDYAMCHGKEVDGKGDVVTDMKLRMHECTGPATLKDRSHGELFYVIENGKNQMPPAGDQVKAEEVWDMVNYVRSFARKQEAAEEKTPN